jgi:hypothetical protein
MKFATLVHASETVVKIVRAADSSDAATGDTERRMIKIVLPLTLTFPLPLPPSPIPNTKIVDDGTDETF